MMMLSEVAACGFIKWMTLKIKQMGNFLPGPLVECLTWTMEILVEVLLSSESSFEVWGPVITHAALHKSLCAAF